MRASLGKAPRLSLSEAQLRSQLPRAASIGQEDAGDSQQGARRCRGSAAGSGQSARRSVPARPQGTWGRPSSAPSQQNGTNGPQDFLRRSTQVNTFGLALLSCMSQSGGIRVPRILSGTALRFSRCRLACIFPVHFGQRMGPAEADTQKCCLQVAIVILTMMCRKCLFIYYLQMS